MSKTNHCKIKIAALMETSATSVERIRFEFEVSVPCDVRSLTLTAGKHNLLRFQDHLDRVLRLG